MNEWLLLTATLPTSPSALRVRIWRALKATGCGALRDGVYLLPSRAGTADDFREIESAVLSGGAEAHLLTVAARDDAQERKFYALFDRTEVYADLLQAIKEARGTVKTATEPELRKTLRGVEQQMRQIEAIDFFPGKPRDRASTALIALRTEVERKLSPGEPTAQSAVIRRQLIDDYQVRIWATRKRPWIDRLATAWLVRRFIDPKARFCWIADVSDCPKQAVGFDFDGATFTHVEDKVTFEVVMHTFLDPSEPGLQRLAELVHYIDVGGIPIDAAAGVETVVRGLQAEHDNDDDLLNAAMPLFDALLAAMRTTP